MSIDYFDDIEQGTEEWHLLRLGILTASQFGTLITKTGKVSNSKGVDSLACKIAGERILMQIEEESNYTSTAMERGHLEESLARDLYSKNYAPVIETGFVTNNSLGFRLGYSPDGLVGDVGLIEVKSRMAKYQIETIIKNEVPEDYMLQLQVGLFVTERSWIDFLSYSNGMPMFRKRVYPDPKMFDAIKEAAVNFEARVNQMIDDFKLNSEGLIKTEFVKYALGDKIYGVEND